MMFIDNSLKNDPRLIGGTVYYGFPLYIAITHVYQGRIESSLNWRTFDFPLWIFFLLLTSTAMMIAWQLRRNHTEE
jgi:hypothetical protein